jgi:hypothetical protein
MAREPADSATIFVPIDGWPTLEMILSIVRRQCFAAIGPGRARPRLGGGALHAEQKVSC